MRENMKENIWDRFKCTMEFMSFVLQLVYVIFEKV